MKFIPSSEAQLGAARRVGKMFLVTKVYCKLFTTNILSTRLAAPRSPRMSLYPVGLVRHLFFTCDECVYVGFSLTKQQAFFWKVSSNSCLIGCDQLYTGHASGSSREKGFNKLTVTWCSGNNEVVSSTPPTMANTRILRICTKYYTSDQPPFEIPNTSSRDQTHLYNTFILASLQTIFTHVNLVKVFPLLYQKFFLSAVRIVNGPNSYTGRLELYIGSQWQSICVNWDIRDAKVVCRVLNMGEALDAKSESEFGSGTSTSSRFYNCQGNEPSLSSCSSGSSNGPACASSQANDSSIHCSHPGQ